MMSEIPVGDNITYLCRDGLHGQFYGSQASDTFPYLIARPDALIACTKFGTYHEDGSRSKYDIVRYFIAEKVGEE